MVDPRDVRMDLLTSKEVAEYTKRSDLVILPVGCFEFHGPKVPLACDAINAWAAGILLAERWRAICAPPVYYTYPGASGPWPGSMDVSPDITQEYIKEIVCGFLKNGFGRVVLCGIHAPLQWMLENVIRSIYQDTGQLVLSLMPRMLDNALMTEKLGYRGGEDVTTLASLKVLGLHGAYDPAVDVAEDKTTGSPLESLTGLWSRGANVAWLFNADHQHTGIRKGLKLEDADRILQVMSQAVENMADIPELFAQYQKDMTRLDKNKPWNRDDVWSV